MPHSSIGAAVDPMLLPSHASVALTDCRNDAFTFGVPDNGSSLSVNGEQQELTPSRARLRRSYSAVRLGAALRQRDGHLYR